MTTAPRTARPARIAGHALLIAGSASALLPIAHWALGSAGTAMAYLVGTGVVMTAGMVLLGATADRDSDDASVPGDRELVREVETATGDAR